MNKYFTTGFFKFLLGFSLLILASFVAISLASGGASAEKTIATPPASLPVPPSAE